MRFLRQSVLGLFLAAVTAGLLAFAAIQVTSAIRATGDDRGGGPPTRERVLAASVVSAMPGSATPTLEAFGQIRSWRTLEIRATASGRVAWLAPEFVEGGSVEAGQPLVEVDPTDARAALERAQADASDAEAEGLEAERAVEIARAEVAAAERQVELRRLASERERKLLDSGAGTRARIEGAELSEASAEQALLGRRQALANAEARVDQSRTRRERAQIALRQAERDLADTVIEAGFGGTLSGVSLVQGRLVTRNEKLADLVDPEALEVSFQLSTEQHARLLGGDGRLLPADVVVRLDAGGLASGENGAPGDAALVATGKLDRDGAVAVEGQSGRQVFARLDAVAGFKPGDFVSVLVTEPAIEGVTRLPASSVDAFSTVLALGPEDRLESIRVVVARRQGDDVLVRPADGEGDGLRGREIVTGRTPLLGPGIKVRPIRRGSGAEGGESGPGSGNGAGASGASGGEEELVELDEERRAGLVAIVEGNSRMPEEAKARLLRQLAQPRVPARLVERIESRGGGRGGRDG